MHFYPFKGKVPFCAFPMPRTLFSTHELSLRKQAALNIGRASIYSKSIWPAINWDISSQSGFVFPGFQFRLSTSFQNYLLKCYLSYGNTLLIDHFLKLIYNTLASYIGLL